MMMARCFNLENKAYPRYGGRGITVDSTLQNMELYIEYVMSLPNFDLSLEIDRIDNNKGYEVGNIRFVDRVTNCRNTERNMYVEYNGERILFQDFTRKYTDLSTTRARVYWKRGYSLEEITKIIPKAVGRRVPRL
jgi:hypothetical protein